MDIFRKKIENELKKLTGLKEVVLEIPPDKEMGDYAFPCFELAKKEKRNPNAISQDIAKKFKLSDDIREVKVIGPYLNFFVNKKKLAEAVLKKILEEKDAYGAGQRKKEKIMVEYSQANTHKAFHVGHLRGTSLGEGLSRILKFEGYDVIQANYQGDTGAHVAKWLWCYLKFHKGEKPPKENAEEWVASIYVEAVKKTDEETQKEIDEINYNLENNSDKELTKLWKESRKWSLDSLEKVYKDIGAHFDVFFFEREVEERGKEIAKELVKKGIAEISMGATAVNLEKCGLGVWVLLRKDGTCLYSAKDIALAEKKFKEFKIDKSIYVVGAAQSLHLRQLFKTLELMGFKQADKCFYLSFAEVRLPTGKMSSRTGENILYSHLKEEMLAKIKDEVEKRHSEWNQAEKEKAIKNIFSAAIKFEMLEQDPNKNIVFDIERAMDFEGETGPYIQYAHARICSILKKEEKKTKSKVILSLLENEHETKVIEMLSKYPEILEKCSRDCQTKPLARYLLELSKAFNEFYHQCPVLKAEEGVKHARLALIKCVKQVLKTGLNLLAIDAPEQM